ncbi:MAG: PTS sugar transporter subunit IIA [Spirochaetales bacterium]|nr:PTS sugar transporter subunit IIA [Spirochaetales bacterium]
MNIIDLITPETVCFINNGWKRDVLELLTEKAALLEKIDNAEVFQQAIEERESLLSTGIGLGVAIPHAKIESVRDFFIITGILSTPVSWDSIDHKPVSLVFMIGGPDEAQVQYLQLLSQLMFVVKNDNKRKKLMGAKTAEEFVEQLAL